MHTGTEHARFCENGHTADTVEFHFYVWVAEGVSEVREMRTPGCVLGVSFYNDCVFVEGFGEAKGCLGLLPGVQVVGLFAAKPVGKRTPYICFMSAEVEIVKVVYTYSVQ